MLSNSTHHVGIHTHTSESTVASYSPSRLRIFDFLQGTPTLESFCAQCCLRLLRLLRLLQEPQHLSKQLALGPLLHLDFRNRIPRFRLPHTDGCICLRVPVPLQHSCSTRPHFDQRCCCRPTPLPISSQERSPAWLAASPQRVATLPPLSSTRSCSPRRRAAPRRAMRRRETRQTRHAEGAAADDPTRPAQATHTSPGAGAEGRMSTLASSVAFGPQGFWTGSIRVLRVCGARS